MRFVAAGRIVIGTVDDFLKHEMPSRILSQIGLRQKPAKVLQVAVQIAAHEYLGHVLQRHDAATPARRFAETRNGTAERTEDAIRIRHDTHDEEKLTTESQRTQS